MSELRLVPRKKPKRAGTTPRRAHFSELPRPTVRTLAVASGKGGVGKSNVVANLAVAMGELGASVVVVDADFGHANLDLLLGLNPGVDLLSVLRGECDVEHIVTQGPAGVRLVPAGSGDARLSEVDDVRREGLLREIGAVAADADLVLIDTASGSSRQVTSLALAARELLLVTTPEPTAYADTYGLLKILAAHGLVTEPGVLVNSASSAEDAEEFAHRLASVSRRFLRKRVHSLGYLPFDPALPRAVQRQVPAVLAFPTSPFAVQMKKLAAWLLERSPDGAPVGDLPWNRECA